MVREFFSEVDLGARVPGVFFQTQKEEKEYRAIKSAVTNLGFPKAPAHSIFNLSFCKKLDKNPDIYFSANVSKIHSAYKSEDLSEAS